MTRRQKQPRLLSPYAPIRKGDSEKRLITKWGDVPTVTLLGLRDLETGELLISEQVAA